LHASFNADGRRLLTASDSNTARIWDVASGNLLAPLLRHKGVVTFAQFSADDKLVFTADDEQLARVWDAGTGELLTPPLRFTGAVRAAAFARDNTAVELTGDDGTTWSWDLRPDDRPVADFRELAEVLSGNHIDHERGLVPLDLEAWRSAWQLVRSRHPEDFGPLPTNSR
jgi:WD40 repeat protein